ncbi:MAG: NO-inducible flavohemoprotein [SAR86 cluster bacterium]|uniref:Flavohemoprotein n=1 Tax=SAR86 cluster bacterium TaxID=2030880 RepID=A0A2A4MT90_9GAMM|nr:MAG: NO-inducible flavohemoprotein [SAR86 cluster bacterium]
MLSSTTVDIIKATVPALKIHANAITEQFYPLLFKQYPEVLPYFNQSNQVQGTQAKALANAVVAYGANIDALGNLSEAVSIIVQKHCSLGVLPQQYDAVGDCLLQAIKIVLGDAATDEVISAWAEAYGQLAKILIDAEESVYAETEKKPGGWRGEREFRLSRKEQESSVITSFYFEPSDAGEIVEFEAGQYITLLLNIEGQATRRNYSLSDAPGTGYLRISVKREGSGLVSSYLHDQLKLGDTLNLLAPCGDFVLRKTEKPLVLLTAGVGITPAISMLNVEAGSGREIQFIHAALNSQVHAFKDHVQEMTDKHSTIKSLTLYSQPSSDCSGYVEGFINSELIGKALAGQTDVDLYFLGPKAFMQSAVKIAKALGIPQAQQYFEFFGPKQDLAA